MSSPTQPTEDKGTRRPSVFAPAERFDVRIPLRPDFRFAHEPLDESIDDGSDGDLFVGRERETADFAARVLLSRGGAFLVTGYRGVGKTSFVNHVLRRLREHLDERNPDTLLLDVRLNLARPMRAVEVMHQVIRGLYRRVVEKGLLDQLDETTARELRDAYDRTLYQISRTSTRGTEIGAELSSPIAKVNAAATETHETELEYLAYDDKSSEHDIIRLSRALANGTAAKHVKRRWSWRSLFRRKIESRPLKIVFVFDELDKLDKHVEADGPHPVGQMVESLKNVFTTSGIAFVFVAGREFEERWHRDLARGDSIYESVFGYQRYLGLLWNASGSMLAVRLRDAVDTTGSEAPDGWPESWKGRPGLDLLDVYRDLEDYLAYQGRGIPRRMLYAFHPFVRWDGEHPYIGLTRREGRSIRFLAEVQRTLESNITALLRERPGDEHGAEYDQSRLGIHYLVDWIVARGERAFTEQQACGAVAALSRRVALSSDLAADVVGRLVELFVEEEFLEAVDANAVVVGSRGERVERYRLRPDRVAQVGEESTLAQGPGTLPFAAMPGTALGEKYPVGPRYRAIERLADGGLATVWRCLDQLTAEEVCIKVLSRANQQNDMLAQHIVREAKHFEHIGAHPGIAGFYRSDKSPEGRPFLVLESIRGTTVRELIRSRSLEPVLALTIASKAAKTYAEIHERGVFRLDIKPENLMVADDGRILVVDLGISLRKDQPALREGLVVGTPVYMAPEQFSGEEFDERVDVYAFGVLLYELLVGRLPFDRQTAQDMLQSTGDTSFPPLAEVAPDALGALPDLDGILQRALAIEPEQRTGSMAIIRDELGQGFRAPGLLSELVQVTREEIATQDEETKFGDEQQARSQQRQSSVQVPPPASAAAPPSPSPPSPTVSAPDEDDDLEPESASGAGARLEQVAGPEAVLNVGGTVIGVTRVIPIRDGLVAGRHIRSDLILDDLSASRRHFRIVESDTIHAGQPPTAGPWFLTDLGTANGTLLNGELLHKTVELNDGDRIEVGPFAFVFRT